MPKRSSDPNSEVGVNIWPYGTTVCNDSKTNSTIQSLVLLKKGKNPIRFLKIDIYLYESMVANYMMADGNIILPPYNLILRTYEYIDFNVHKAVIDTLMGENYFATLYGQNSKGRMWIKEHVDASTVVILSICAGWPLFVSNRFLGENNDFLAQLKEIELTKKRLAIEHVQDISFGRTGGMSREEIINSFQCLDPVNMLSDTKKKE